jgi:hypothetical protein
MIDGVVVDWSLPQGCSDMLELVLSDVNDATLADREKHRLALEQVTDNDKPALSLNSLKNRHKKQRSLLMTLVTYVQFILPYIVFIVV